eukprot:8141787-Ditylum_brightwellii.AAC.1
MSTGVRGAPFDRSEIQDALMGDSRIAATITSTFCGGLRLYGPVVQRSGKWTMVLGEDMELYAFQWRRANDQRVLMIGFCQGPFVGSKVVVVVER